METKDLAPLPVDKDNNHIQTPEEKVHDDAVADKALAEAGVAPEAQAHPVSELEKNAETGAAFSSPNLEVGSASPLGLSPGAIVTSNSGNGTRLSVESINGEKAHCSWHDHEDSQQKSGDFDLNDLTVVESAAEAKKDEQVVIAPSEHHDGVVADVGEETVVHSGEGAEGTSVNGAPAQPSPEALPPSHADSAAP